MRKALALVLLMLAGCAPTGAETSYQQYCDLVVLTEHGYSCLMGAEGAPAFRFHGPLEAP